MWDTDQAPGRSFDVGGRIYRPRSWMAALLLCVTAGFFGLHNFYLGYRLRGAVRGDRGRRRAHPRACGHDGLFRGLRLHRSAVGMDLRGVRGHRDRCGPLLCGLPRHTVAALNGAPDMALIRCEVDPVR